MPTRRAMKITAANVVQLRIVQKDPDQDVIATLLKLLAEAQSGNVIGLVAAAQRADGEIILAGCGSLTENLAAGHFAASKLAARLMAQC